MRSRRQVMAPSLLPEHDLRSMYNKAASRAITNTKAEKQLSLIMPLCKRVSF